MAKNDDNSGSDEEDLQEEVDDADEDAQKKKRRKRKRKRSTKATANAEGGDEDTEPSQEELKDDTHRTVFVEGVPYDATPEQVAECLQKHAEIDRADIVELRFPTWQDSGRMRGYGHVVFSTKRVIEKVLQVAQSGQKLWMGRRYLSLQQARPKGLGPANAMNQQQNKEPSKTIMIKNLDYDATEDDVLSVMKQFGAVVEGGVRIARNFQTRQNKGFAYVEFEDLESAKKAMKRQEQQQPNNSKPLYILKRACILDYDEGRVKGSFKTSSGRLWSKEYKETSKKTRST